MFPILRNIIGVVQKCPLVLSFVSNYHILSPTNLLPNRLLAPVVHDITPSCGFKVKGRVRRRCKDCYMVMREQRMYVLCKTHPRHKQMTLAKDPKNTWILSHATQGKVRPW
jgi:large subunit ribosomal protein L36